MGKSFNKIKAKELKSNSSGTNNETELRHLYRISQPVKNFQLVLKNEYKFEDKSGLAIVRGFLQSGTEVRSNSNLHYSTQLGGYFKYFPEGSNEKWIKFIDLSFDEPVTTIRIDFVAWNKPIGQDIPWSRIQTRLLHPIVNDALSTNPIALGSFEVTPEEVK